MASAVHVVEDPETLHVLAHPIRIRILDALDEPDSAAGVARRVGEARQKINYHLKELERVGLVVRRGKRKTGNFVETLYASATRTVLVSPRATWGDERRLEAMQDQLALEHLVHVGERLSHDAAQLLDRAAFDGDEISSAAVETEIHLRSSDDRSAFMNEYLAAIAPVLRKYGQRRGPQYKVAFAVYPDPASSEERQ